MASLDTESYGDYGHDSWCVWCLAEFEQRLHTDYTQSPLPPTAAAADWWAAQKCAMVCATTTSILLGGKMFIRGYMEQDTLVDTRFGKGAPTIVFFKTFRQQMPILQVMWTLATKPGLFIPF